MSTVCRGEGELTQSSVAVTPGHVMEARGAERHVELVSRGQEVTGTHQGDVGSLVTRTQVVVEQVAR